MLIDKLKTWKYYYDKLPLYFKNDERIEEHFRCIFDMLVQVDLVEDQLCKSFDVMADDYLEFINSLDESTEKDHSKILEYIGNLYGVTRDFNVTVDKTDKALHLNNAELLILIKARIIQMNYDGSYKMAKEFYESVDLPICIYYENSASAKVYLDESATELSENVIDMFKAGLFIIKSMGISYETLVVIDPSLLFTFDTVDQARMWDVGLWL